MNLLPQASGGRPRLACEIFPDAVVAARSPEAGLPLASVSRFALPEGAVLPGLKPGNVADRVAVISTVRRALEGTGARPNSRTSRTSRTSEVTLVIPDAAVRVLLLDFDSLPAKLSEALPIVRFRLKKLVPFDAESAMVSFQVLSSSRSAVRVLAVAVPRDVLGEYELVVREAGFEPGSVLPSTLAALAALETGDSAALVVNAGPDGLTTAIVHGSSLLLHRTVELREGPATLSPAYTAAASPEPSLQLPLVNRESTEAEWAAQEPEPAFGRNPYADRQSAETSVQGEDGITGLRTPAAAPVPPELLAEPRPAQGIDMYAAEAAPVLRSPYASAALQQQLDAQFQDTVYLAPAILEETAGTPFDMEHTPGRPSAEAPSAPVSSPPDALPLSADFSAPLTPGPIAGPYDEAEAFPPVVHTLQPDVRAEEIARAVAVAVAFFEDHLSALPEVLLSSGPLGTGLLEQYLLEQGNGTCADLRTRDLLSPDSVAAGAASALVPRNLLAGVAGALRG